MASIPISLCSAPLPPRGPATRRVDFAIGQDLWPTATFERPGIADHDLVGHDINLQFSLQALVPQPHLPFRDDPHSHCDVTHYHIVR